MTSASKVSTKKQLKAALNTLMWVLLLILVITEIGGFDLSDTLICSSYFLINYIFLIQLLLFKRKFLSFIFSNIVLFTLFSLFGYLTDSIITKQFIFLLLISLGLSIAIKTTQYWLTFEIERKEKESQYYKTELALLRYQIQPHFFFNSLNNIYSLIDISPEKAKETVYGLGKLMRYLLYQTSSDSINLDSEIEFLRNFIELMKLRVRDNVKISAHFPDSTQGVMIAPFLFIPLLENAFKHGISSNKPSEILIDLRLENQQLLCIVQNTFFPKGEYDKSGSGVGLENLRTRLRLLYPNSHSFIQNKTDNYFTSTLKINL
ncbi:MAG: histidine kinase [Bacteroidetes bacterium]|nr:histidine kinase [Bacteroidota bacterium]